jgi:hypothetical protein
VWRNGNEASLLLVYSTIIAHWLVGRRKSNAASALRNGNGIERAYQNTREHYRTSTGRERTEARIKSEKIYTYRKRNRGATRENDRESERERERKRRKRKQDRKRATEREREKRERVEREKRRRRRRYSHISIGEYDDE